MVVYTIKWFMTLSICLSACSLIYRQLRMCGADIFQDSRGWGLYGGIYVDVTQNNKSSQLRTISNATRVFYDCSELRDLRQTSTLVPSYGTSVTCSHT